MFRQRMMMMLVLVLAALTAACESDPLAFETLDQIADDELQAVLDAESGARDPRGDRDHVDRRPGTLFDQLAEQIPGFGGIYRTSPCVIALVLTADADAESAERIVRAAIEPIVARHCADGIRIDIVRGQFTYIELRRFLLASRPLNNIEGVAGAYISFKANRLVILVASREVAGKVVLALPRVGIPERAVIFRRARTDERVHDTATTD